ncbi:MAG: hypothetical protein KGZ25_14625, partial [Planctomycetes bacterium]|nr:hypothetical protein [Planctomycetota bacterium]
MRNQMSSGRKRLAATRRHQARRDTGSRSLHVLTSVLALVCALALFIGAAGAASTTDAARLIAEARRLREQDPSMQLLQKKTQQVEDEIVADWNAQRYGQWARGHLRKLAYCLHAQHWAYHLRLREGSHPETPKKTTEV